MMIGERKLTEDPKSHLVFYEIRTTEMPRIIIHFIITKRQNFPKGYADKLNAFYYLCVFFEHQTAGLDDKPNGGRNGRSVSENGALRILFQCY